MQRTSSNEKCYFLRKFKFELERSLVATGVEKMKLAMIIITMLLCAGIASIGTIAVSIVQN